MERERGERKREGRGNERETGEVGVIWDGVEWKWGCGGLKKILVWGCLLTTSNILYQLLTVHTHGDFIVLPHLDDGGTGTNDLVSSAVTFD